MNFIRRSMYRLLPTSSRCRSIPLGSNQGGCSSGDTSTPSIDASGNRTNPHTDSPSNRYLVVVGLLGEKISLVCSDRRSIQGVQTAGKHPANLAAGILLIL